MKRRVLVIAALMVVLLLLSGCGAVEYQSEAKHNVKKQSSFVESELRQNKIFYSYYDETDALIMVDIFAIDDHGSIKVDYVRNYVFASYLGADDELVYEEKYLKPEELSEYKLFLEAFSDQLIKDERLYTGPEYDPDTDYSESRGYWTLRATYADGRTVTVECSDWGVKIYPDNWNEFVRRTNEILGTEVFGQV